MSNFWYKNAVFYEMNIRGFKDSNADGIGDFLGAASKLDYLKSLGIDCIWLLPMYPTPGNDDGYAISTGVNCSGTPTSGDTSGRKLGAIDDGGWKVYNAAWRFDNIAVPSNSTITSATFTLTRISGVGDVTFNLYGHNVDDSPSLTEEEICSREVTSGVYSTFTTGVNEFDVTDIISTITDRPGWELFANRGSN